jgi:RNA polymerase sigma-70 factor (ECF subfamily)
MSTTPAPHRLDPMAAARAARFAVLLRDHEPALRELALRLCRSAVDAHDLVQDTLERGLRSYDRLAPGSNFRAWLFSILRNRFIDKCRREAVARRSECVAAVEQAASEAPEPEVAWSDISSEQLRDAVNRLRPHQRAVFQMHALEGRSYLEIASTLNIAKATVGTRLLRARRELRAILTQTSSQPSSPSHEPRRLARAA